MEIQLFSHLFLDKKNKNQCRNHEKLDFYALKSRKHLKELKNHKTNLTSKMYLKRVLKENRCHRFRLFDLNQNFDEKNHGRTFALSQD